MNVIDMHMLESLNIIDENVDVDHNVSFPLVRSFALRKFG